MLRNLRTACLLELWCVLCHFVHRAVPYLKSTKGKDSGGGGTTGGIVLLVEHREKYVTSTILARVEENPRGFLGKVTCTVHRTLHGTPYTLV